MLLVGQINCTLRRADLALKVHDYDLKVIPLAVKRRNEESVGGGKKQLTVIKEREMLAGNVR